MVRRKYFRRIISRFKTDSVILTFHFSSGKQVEVADAVDHDVLFHLVGDISRLYHLRHKILSVHGSHLSLCYKDRAKDKKCPKQMALSALSCVFMA